MAEREGGRLLNEGTRGVQREGGYGGRGVRSGAYRGGWILDIAEREGGRLLNEGTRGVQREGGYEGRGVRSGASEEEGGYLILQREREGGY